MAVELSVRLFKQRQIQPNGCWLWTGLLDRDGYGRLHHDGRMRILHRIAFQALVGPIPEGLTLDHLCRNRACFNPNHLEPVTLQENIHRGQRAAPKTHCVHGHLYDEKNTFLQGDGVRRCKACRREQARSRKLRRAA